MAPAADVDVAKLHAALDERVDGEVRFDFEAGHYEVSVACTEHGLWPAVRDARPEVAVLADGFSCRMQIQAGHLGREGIHLAQLLAEPITNQSN
jgi:hypothetical protein